tara:strand:+ start:4989 stop:5216 length:228 start_codon:yes stop_codon:yes gene_type:complete
MLDSQAVQDAIFKELDRVGEDLDPEDVLDALAYMLVSYARLCDLSKFEFLNAVSTVWEICGAEGGELSDSAVGDA